MAEQARIELNTGEIALCIGALEVAARDLREGKAAADRLGTQLPDRVMDYAEQMDKLKERFRGLGEQ